MDAKTLVLYLCNNNQVNKMSLSLQLQYVTSACRMYYVDVSQLRTLWNCCGLVSVQETAVIWSLQLSYSFRYSFTRVLADRGTTVCSYGELFNIVRG